MVASSATPQLAAAAMANRSSRTVISSTAMIWGLAARSRIGMPSALGQPSSTSVWQPTASCGVPWCMPATSPRSSTTAMRWAGRSSAPSDRLRIISRSSVVLPSPGGDKITVERNRPSSHSCGSTGADTPSCSRPMRMQIEDRSRRLRLSPSRTTAVPHTPIRKPPGAVR